MDRFDQTMSQVVRSVDTAMDHWQGNGARAAQGRAEMEHQAGNHLAAGLLAVTDALNAGQGGIGAARDAVLHLVTTAESRGMTVADDGTVTAPAAPAGIPTTVAAIAAVDPIMATMALAYLEQQAEAEMLTVQIHGGLIAVDAADQAAAAAVAAAIGALAGAAAASSPGQGVDAAAAPYVNGSTPLPTDPAALNALWRTFSAADKDALFAKDSNLGNRDGIPVADRDHYNRLNLPTLTASAQATVDQLTAQHPDWAQGKNIPTQRSDVDFAWKYYDSWHTKLQAAQDKLSGFEAVDKQVAGRSDRFLMQIDDGGRGAIAINNPDTAPNVTTFVPGTGTKLPDIAKDMGRSETMLGQAIASGAPADSSVITWYGYNAPPEIPDAAHIHWADAGAPRLDSFQDGLRVTHDGAPSYNVVLGHSYGTTVIGDAAAGGHHLAADNVVLLASPGADADHAGDLHLDGIPQDQVGQHIFATKAANDPVPLASHLSDLSVAGGPAGAVANLIGEAVTGHTGGPFGIDPTSSDFGGQVFTSDPGPTGPWYYLGYNPSVHSNYWDVGPSGPCASLKNIGDIMAGNTGAVK
ncbi:alpha/beta hydrolase [Speluncibacter jeojiensis]|uniref:Alpha/beta hydrolase family protein n=1 Tax=Speluncibacter jeojiensis TaxID=2710754 RepID=A0A9X4M0E7_9ACTN|nr:alpha/beta hydrolase family protein [Corynebacteriales bacterium D3-21]